MSSYWFRKFILYLFTTIILIAGITGLAVQAMVDFNTGSIHSPTLGWPVTIIGGLCLLLFARMYIRIYGLAENEMPPDEDFNASAIFSRTPHTDNFHNFYIRLLLFPRSKVGYNTWGQPAKPPLAQ